MASRKDSKGRVLKEGESQRKDGRYCYRYMGLDGKRKYIYSRDLNELRKMERQATKDVEDHIYSNNITMNECFDRYMETKINIRETTRHSYNIEYDRWIRNTWFGRKIIKDIHKSDVLLFYKEKSETLSAGSVRALHKYINPALEMAVDDDLIRKNPAKNCTKDLGTSPKKKALTADEVVRMLDYAENCYPYGKMYLLAIKIMLGTGLRIGECIGLTWDDLDFQNSKINISKQFVLIAGNGKHEYHISEPKTSSGVRVIPMSADVRQMLLEHKEQTYFKSTRFGASVDGYSGFVFHTRSGLPVLPNRVNDYLEKLTSSYNELYEEPLPKLSCHLMRHTFCTRMAELGINPKTLQYLMGHSNYRVTADFYITETAEHAKQEFERVVSI